MARPFTPALLAGCLLLAVTAPLRAQTTLPPFTVGAGVLTSYVHDMPDEADSTDAFLLNSVRLYVNGSATDKIKLEFNTEYDGVSNQVRVLDAIAKFELSPKFNVWAGRLLPPSDRANLYGNYYAHHWFPYTDGVQDGYPFVATGRDNGAAYWGQFGIVKVQAGAFDGSSATGDDTMIGAGRVMVDFWDAEPGYYLNGTYYGEKNILAIGAAGQVQGSDNKAYSLDFLLERKLSGAGAVTIESEYAKYDKLGGYNPRYGTDEGAFVLGSYLFPPAMGMTGRFEVLGKFAKATFGNGASTADPDYDQKTSEFNFNYIIKDFKARVMFFFKNTTFSAVQTDFKQVGVGLQVQM